MNSLERTFKRLLAKISMFKMKNIPIVFVILWTTIVSCSVSLTWSSSINSMLTARTLIPRTTGVDRDIIDSIGNGAQIAMNHCKDIFKWDKWNCPVSTFSRGLRHPANREQAFAHAIVSAGIVHSITKNCSKGQLQGCGCSPYLRGSASLKDKNLFKTDIKSHHKQQQPDIINWSWGGCSDDVEFGQLMAKLVLDEMERGNDNQAYVNLHNNFVGRQIVQNTMIKKCKCHGVSGSCSLQTCWMQVAPFSKITNILKQRYKRAIKIDLENTSNKILRGNSSPPLSIIEKHPHISPKRLLFLEYSPDYCMANSTTGWVGTKGRMCSRSRLETTSLAEKRSCKTLCRSCGHRVRKHKKQIQTRCNCTFKWCCDVRCETCTETVDEYFCE